MAIQNISAELESLFSKQATITEELEDASRGYGLLLHAFGLRTEQMRAQCSEDIKTIVSLKKWSRINFDLVCVQDKSKSIESCSCVMTTYTHFVQFCSV